MTRREAWLIAVSAHEGQLDKCGDPYVFHVLEVEAAVEKLGEGFSVVALMHDVFEDTIAEVEDFEDHPLRVRKSPILTPAQAKSLRAITRVEGEQYRLYIRRCKQDFVARVVKIADLRHNLSPERVDGLSAEEAASLMPRYRKSLTELESNG